MLERSLLWFEVEEEDGSKDRAETGGETGSEYEKVGDDGLAIAGAFCNWRGGGILLRGLSNLYAEVVLIVALTHERW
jgi:hypothetical protein